MSVMRVRRLTHAALLVTDLDRARAFYGRVLGLTEKARPEFDFPGAWYDLGECELHLMSTSEALPAADKWPRRDNHISFQVEDIDAARRALEEAGLRFRGSSSSRGSIFVRDPDGNLIELQPPGA